ncbi:MAG: hypothetical protein V3V99_11085 [candidate division Zixibacteria bacterium]
MSINNILDNKATLIKIVIPLIIILIPFVYSLVSFVVAKATEPVPPLLERPDPQYEKCVKDTDYMRYHHWELLRAVREEVVRYGKRGEIGLNGCRECHTSRERFCDKCHNAVSLTPNCFGCHNYP